jgi:hypothetical protein
MAPTLLGRLQTRILLFLSIGLPVTVLYAIWLSGRSRQDPSGASPEWIVALAGVRLDIRPVQILCLLLLVGAVLDFLYIQLQHFRWDRDWPFAFQFVASIGEFAIVLALVKLDMIPFMPSRWVGAGDYPYLILHFAWFFVPSFVALLGFIQIFMVRWRHKGCEWGRL